MAQTFEESLTSDLDDLYAAALCFTQDEHRAEELLQEAAIRAFHEFHSPLQSAEFRVWMLGLLAATHLRRERRRGQDPFKEGVEPIHAEDEGVQEAFSAFPERGTRAYEWLRVWLDRAWVALDPGDRLVLWLVAVERLRHRRVAEILGLDEEQVRRRHYRARRTLSLGAAEHIKHGTPGSAEA